ncbi:winged helix-turn-helix transcriptional regulator [Bacillus sp. SD075]|uniref:winged helix-turn-helix transcriptional regulator n=1 Tax=Bacillus sp. SD075 TaxID=2781732 RepID=UPI001A9606E9|nr:winged helix-turn-helix transcriptional regulator [Bacillus sp. SD075]MBO0997337.1 winged helix-turn-helix transcriptional regulator [Bacillus sp. SD075]
MLPNISKGILTGQLRELGENGMVHRDVYKEVPPKVEYSLTPYGKSFMPVLDIMGSGIKNIWKKNKKNKKTPHQVHKKNPFYCPSKANYTYFWTVNFLIQTKLNSCRLCFMLIPKSLLLVIYQKPE